MKYVWAAACAAALALWPQRVATARTLSLDDALEQARRHAPSLLAAQASIDEARGRLLGASILLRENPELDTAAGGRFVERGTLLEGSIGLRQLFELGGRRQARMDAASAGVARSTATLADATRRLLRETAVGFLVAVHARERQHLAERTVELLTDTAHIAERRHQAGDLGVLDVNVATAAMARARSEVQAQSAATEAALGALRLALGMEAMEPLDLVGDLHDRGRFELPELLDRAPERPDLQALLAESKEAHADAELGRALRWPNLGLAATYERDDGRNLALGTISVSLPVFERGQGLAAEALARKRRAELTLEASRRAIDVEVRTAFVVYQHREEAVAELEKSALPDSEANETLARRSYEAGELRLVELLAVRREFLDVKSEYLNRLLEASIAGVDLEAAAGVLP